MIADTHSRLSVRGVSKAFGATQALLDVELEAAAGEVLAIVGENGAGKSTLMKILSGALRPDQGVLAIDAEPYAPSDTLAARAAGVAIVYQEAPLCQHMTIAENVLLGAERSRLGFLERRRDLERVKQALAEVGIEGAGLEPWRSVSELAPSQRQLVAIARALAQSECKILILDEPTASLTASDTERLFAVIRRLKATGIAVLYISHFLEEVERIADAYVVFRDGQSVGSGRIADVDAQKLVSMMAGRKIEQVFVRSKREPGEVLLRVEGLAGRQRPLSASFELRRGEVLGIAGLIGSGRSELLRAIFGLDAARAGQIRVKEFLGPASPHRRLAQGVGMLSEDRKGEGLAEALSLADNLTLSRLSGLGPWGLVLPHRQERATESYIERLGIRCSGPTARASSLSGGNQQKVALARLLYHDVDVLLLDEPTRGIDVRSRAEVYRLIDELALRGKGVVMVSSYLPELLGVCDRIAVMRRGRLGPSRPVEELDEHTALLEATVG
jgi:ribose transport system ATP-binding protein